MTDVSRFASLFRGNPDCYGSYGGGYVEGDIPWAYHLDGKTPIGIYPIRDGNLCHWGCIDLDVPDIEHPVNLVRALMALGIESVVERSRAKGWHVWCFLEPGAWHYARQMRRALLVACDIAGAPNREVNPKQEEVEGVGNYVRLPYPNYGAAGTQVFERYATGIGFYPLNFGDGMDYAEARTNAIDPITAAAELWVPPKREHTTPIGLDMRDTIERGLPWHVRERLSKLPLTRSLMEDGGLQLGDEVTDRSATLTHLAHLAQEARFDPSETLAILIEADLTWAHKYIERDHSDRELRRIVERVWA